MSISLVLYVAALILFVIAALPIGSPNQARLMAAGLACLTGAFLLTHH